jgi:hemerythrin-like domain-containing protein
MNREDVIRKAREAGMVVHDQDQPYMEMLERFAQLVKQHVQIEQMPKFEALALLVREDEREACAKMCEELASNPENNEQYRMGANWARERIRARSEK